MTTLTGWPSRGDDALALGRDGSASGLALARVALKDVALPCPICDCRASIYRVLRGGHALYRSPTVICGSRLFIEGQVFLSPPLLPSHQTVLLSMWKCDASQRSGDAYHVLDHAPTTSRERRMSLRTNRHTYHRLLAANLSLSPADFDTLVQEALELLPDWAEPYLEHVAVVVEEEPPEDEDQDLMGLYVGATIFGATSELGLGGPPDMVMVFQGPHERACHGRHQLRREVGETVLHEIAHHFGIEEDTLDDIGPIDPRQPDR